MVLAPSSIKASTTRSISAPEREVWREGGKEGGRGKKREACVSLRML